MLMRPNDMVVLYKKPGQLLGSTSKTPLTGKSWAPNPYSLPWTIYAISRVFQVITTNEEIRTQEQKREIEENFYEQLLESA